MQISLDRIQIPFIKGHANGNDFIFIFKQDLIWKKINKKFISHICNRHFGIGADGLFVISDSTNDDFLLDYYNSDGSWETLCANGSRCAVSIIKSLNKINKQCTFKTGAGVHSASILENNEIKMSMNTPTYQSALISPEGFDGYFIDSGAKHFVCYKNNLNKLDCHDIAKKIRFSKMFAPHGINVNFYNINKQNQIYILTYEKGVEKIMQSCASGSTAVVFHLSQQKHISSPVITRSPGGRLSFSFNEDWSKVYITGTASVICSGNFIANKNYPSS